MSKVVVYSVVCETCGKTDDFAALTATHAKRAAIDAGWRPVVDDNPPVLDKKYPARCPAHATARSG
jgi:hypothetical protein